MAGLADIPAVVIEFIRGVFANANNMASNASFLHPNKHEEQLDSDLVTALAATPPTFFASEQAAVVIENHWLGGRRLWHRWEIADIAFFIIVRRQGHLDTRKVALLQTKRLYSREIAAVPITQADYEIGIGRLADRTDPLLPLSRLRSFKFDASCQYSALHRGAGPEDEAQPELIDHYMEERGIPVYYGFYNPPELPITATYPHLSTAEIPAENKVGHRVQPAQAVHKVLASLNSGQAPTVSQLSRNAPFDANDPSSALGWRLENFIADEVLRCREGILFDDQSDIRLSGLLYGRSAPIASAIAITIDLGRD
jgi:hypothetical protein